MMQFNNDKNFFVNSPFYKVSGVVNRGGILKEFVGGDLPLEPLVYIPELVQLNFATLC